MLSSCLPKFGFYPCGETLMRRQWETESCGMRVNIPVRGWREQSASLLSCGHQTKIHSLRDRIVACGCREQDSRRNASARWAALPRRCDGMCGDSPLNQAGVEFLQELKDGFSPRTAGIQDDMAACRHLVDWLPLSHLLVI